MKTPFLLHILCQLKKNKKIFLAHKNKQIRQQRVFMRLLQKGPSVQFFIQAPLCSIFSHIQLAD
ncbi:MAG: hypothetical protein CSA34_03370 [Desulfobulbus propionicus]|nr:MAG: hypothetical protein CSA34_03370 [Desulfobulbus propionicus]